MRFTTAASGAVAVVLVTARCDYDAAQVGPRYPVAEGTTPRQRPRQPTTGPRALPGLPPSAPRYLPPTYAAALECPMPRAGRASMLSVVPRFEEDADPAGVLGTYQPGGPTNPRENAFFQPLGTNGRACVTCHEPAGGMGLSVERVRLRFKRTRGSDPLFAPVDGANCPNAREIHAGSADVRAAHSLLLTRGLIRIFLPLPSEADFTLSVASDPYRCNTDPAYDRARDPQTGAVRRVVSVYRRPRPATNMKFVTSTATDADPITGQGATNGSNIMWDGREPSLESQAIDATLVHAQAVAKPNEAQVSQMVAFQRGIFSAQLVSNEAHSLTDLGALGGPDFLSTVDVTSDVAPASAPFVLFDAWRTLPAEADRAPERASIFRGQRIFDTRTFVVANVAGFNNVPAVNGPLPTGTCATCHNRTAAGNSTFAAAQLDIGIGGDSAALGGPPPSSDLPVFKIDCSPGASTPFHGSTILTNDPGKALITGKCADVGRFTVAPLRGLAARAPYFSDGSARELLDVVEFYDKRFAIGLSPQDKADLAHFLSAL